MKKIELKKVIKKLVISLIVVLIFAILLLFLCDLLGINALDEQEILEKIESLGVFAPLAYIIFSFLQVSFIPLPGAIVIAIGNYIFGPYLAFLYSFIGIISGSMFSFFLGKKLGRKFVDWIIGDKEIVDYYLNKLKGKESYILFFMFLLPIFPDDALCAIAGIMPITYFNFFIIQLITRFFSISGTLLCVSNKIIPYSNVRYIIIITFIVISIISFIFCMKRK